MYDQLIHFLVILRRGRLTDACMHRYPATFRFFLLQTSLKFEELFYWFCEWGIHYCLFNDVLCRGPVPRLVLQARSLDFLRAVSLAVPVDYCEIGSM